MVILTQPNIAIPFLEVETACARSVEPVEAALVVATAHIRSGVHSSECRPLDGHGVWLTGSEFGDLLVQGVEHA